MILEVALFLLKGIKEDSSVKMYLISLQFYCGHKEIVERFANFVKDNPLYFALSLAIILCITHPVQFIIRKYVIKN